MLLQDLEPGRGTNVGEWSISHAYRAETSESLSMIPLELITLGVLNLKL